MEPIETKNILQPEPLSKRVVRGGIWVFSISVTNRLLGFIRTIVLARLLAPSDFGLLGLAMLAITTLDTFSQTGFQTALIQKKRGPASFLNTAWTVSGIRAIFLFVLLFTTAPLISKFFNSPDAVWVIRIIALSLIFTGFRNIGLLYFQKELQFNKLFFYEFSSTLIDLSIAISLALILRNVWALVWAGLAGQFARLILSYVVHPYRPRLRFDKDEFTELFGFGKWVFASSIIVFIVTQGDDVIVGKMLGIAALGFYQMAYTFSNIPATEIIQVVSRVMLPAYSKLQDDLPKLKQAYLKVLQITAFVSAPLAGGIIALAPEFTEIFLGSKWMPAVPVMRILALSGLFRSIISTTSPVFVSIKRPDVSVKCQIVRMSLLAVLIFPFTINWGIVGVACSVLLSTLTASILFSFRVIRITKITIGEFSKLIILPIVNTMIFILLIEYFKSHAPLITIGQISLIILGAVASYFSIAFIFDRFFNYGMQKVIKKLTL
jgi:O-antigen/teichoic acid export membrane protein